MFRIVGNKSSAGNPTRTRDKKAKIDRIVEATRKLIEEHGYMATNMSKIASRIIKRSTLIIGDVFRNSPFFLFSRNLRTFYSGNENCQ